MSVNEINFPSSSLVFTVKMKVLSIALFREFNFIVSQEVYM